MHFKLIYTILDGYLGRKEDGPIVFAFPGKDKAEVIIRAPTEDEKKIGHEHLCCEARYTKSPKPEIMNMFTSLAEGCLPEGSNLANRPDYIRDDGTIEGKHGPPYDILPESFKSFITQVGHDLRDYLVETYQILRWREDIGGGHMPFSSRGEYWSLDGSEWQGLPGKIMAYMDSPRGIAASLTLCDEVTSMYQRGVREPLAHALFREAYAQRHSNPRSSLILSVTAAEAGVKKLITELQPETEWLLQNTSSPDLLKLLVEYIPKLPVRNKINGKVLSAPLTIRKPLKKAIHMRNIIVHGGECSLTIETLIQILDAVKDLLWLLDYYCGFSWAVVHLSKITKAELNLP